MKRRALVALVAAGALMAPGAALANHVTDVDGPAVSSINGICHSTAGSAWFQSHEDAYAIYANAYVTFAKQGRWALANYFWGLASEHATYVQWYRVACHPVHIV